MKRNGVGTRKKRRGAVVQRISKGKRRTCTGPNGGKERADRLDCLGAGGKVWWTGEGAKSESREGPSGTERKVKKVIGDIRSRKVLQKTEKKREV